VHHRHHHPVRKESIVNAMREPVRCAIHQIEHERADACHLCLRDPANAQDLADRLREHPSEAYNLGPDSCEVMLYWARLAENPVLAAACLAAKDANEPVSFAALPAQLTPLFR
jgi:hypothetical protein